MKKKLLSYLMVFAMSVSLVPSQVEAKAKSDVKLSSKSISVVKGDKSKVKIVKAKKIKISSVKVSGYKKSIVKVTKSKSYITIKGKKNGNSKVKVTIKYKKDSKSYKKNFKIKVAVVNADTSTTTEQATSQETKATEATTTEAKAVVPPKKEEPTTTPEKKDDTKTDNPSTDDKKDEHSHVLVKVEKKEATCKESGNIEYYECSSCGKLYSDNKASKEITAEDTVIKATGHVEGEPSVVVKQPTCTEGGSETTTIKCKFCDAVLSTEVKNLEPLGHDWGEYVTTKTPTILETGEENRTCKRNGSHTESREIPKLDHVHALTKVSAKEATCTTAGNKEYWKCSECERYFEDEEATKELTSEDVTINALGHNAGAPIRTDVVEATCTKEGSCTETVNCTKCGAQISQKTVRIEPLGHIPGEPIAENRVEPTCTVKGTYEEVIKCKSCLEEISRTPKDIPAKGHTAKDPVKENEVAATCTTGGSWDEVVYCKDCGAETNRTHMTSDALGHELYHSYRHENGETIHYHWCQRSGCGFTEDCEFESNVIKEPTCANGVTEYTCKSCGYKYNEFPKAIKEHTYGNEWKTDKEGNLELSYTRNVYARHYCTECGNSSDEWKRMPFADTITSISHQNLEGYEDGLYHNVSVYCNYMCAFEVGGMFEPCVMTFEDVSGKRYAVRVSNATSEGLGIRIYDEDNTEQSLSYKQYKYSERLNTINSINDYCKTNGTDENKLLYVSANTSTWDSLRAEFGDQFSEAINDRDWFLYNNTYYVSYQMFCAFAIDMGYHPKSMCYGWKKYNYGYDSAYNVD